MATSLEQIECPECGQIIHYQPQRWKAQVVCSNCQESVEVEAMTTSVSAGDESTPIPSHLKTPPPSTPAVPAQAQANPSEPMTYKRSKLTGTLVATILSVLAVLGIGGGLAAIAMYDSKSDEKKNEERREERKKEAKESANYLLAGKKRGKIDNIEVGIELVEFGPIRVKDQTFTVHTSNESFLQIYLKLRSRRKGDAQYLSWYGRSFKRNGEDLVVNLTDQDGKAIDMAVFEDIDKIFGHVDKATIGPNERLEDCLVFELPGETKITDIKELRLILPMEAVGSPGDIYFRIPQDQIRVTTVDN